MIRVCGQRRPAASVREYEHDEAEKLAFADPRKKLASGVRALRQKKFMCARTNEYLGEIIPRTSR
jgi:hypothetical protein